MFVGCMLLDIIIFFFSSRRRHTRCSRDWSSDVCSSDLVDAGPVTDRLRVIKSPEEVALLRRAIAITLDAMAATFAQLAVGTTEVQVAQTLSREMEQRGAPGGGPVQFGPSSALAHAGPAGPKLEREAVVLIDC